MKSYPIRVSIKCPCCDQISFFDKSMRTDDIYGTTDCGHCNALLLIEDGIVYEFNERMNAEDSRWPKNGTNTGYIEV